MVYVRECLVMFSSRSFIVSGLTFISLIHFEFIFVYGVRKCSSYSFVSGWPVFPAPLIKEIAFSPLYKTLRGKHRQILSGINHSRIFYDQYPRIMEIKTKINKWDLIKLKTFHTAKEIINKMKRQDENLQNGRKYLQMMQLMKG